MENLKYSALTRENLGDQTISKEQLENMDVSKVPMMEDYLVELGVLGNKKEKGSCCKSCEITAPKWEVVKT